MSEAFEPRAALRRLIAEGHISEDALQAITGIEPAAIRSFVGETDAGTGAGMATAGAPTAISIDEVARLSLLAAQLKEGLPIADDERLQAIYESLTVDCGLTLPNLAGLTGLPLADLENVLRDPGTLPAAAKYALAIRGSYLLNAANRARSV